MSIVLRILRRPAAVLSGPEARFRSAAPWSRLAAPRWRLIARARSTLEFATPLDSVAHIIQVALAPAFLLSALATLLNVFSTRLGRVADKVDQLSGRIESGDPAEEARLGRRLAYLRRRSVVLDAAVVLASLGSVLTGVAVLTLFVGALRDATVASVLFGCFGLALVCTVGAIGAFLSEILMAGRGVRIEVEHRQERAASAQETGS